jgi:hypothetical protein
MGHDGVTLLRSLCAFSATVRMLPLSAPVRIILTSVVRQLSDACFLTAVAPRRMPDYQLCVCRIPDIRDDVFRYCDGMSHLRGTTAS